MHTQANKTTETKSNAVANGVAVQQGEGTFQLEDNRPETIAQRRIQDAANNSAHVKQLKAIQALANKSSQIKQLRAVQKLWDEHTATNQNSGSSTIKEGTVKNIPASSKAGEPPATTSAQGVVQRKLWVEGELYEKSDANELAIEFEDKGKAIHWEAVQDVLIPYIEGGPVFYNLTREGLKNHVYKTLGSVKYGEPVDEPMLLFDEKWVQDLNRRFEHAMWQNLRDKDKEMLFEQNTENWEKLVEAVATIEGHWRRRGYYNLGRPVGEPLHWINDYIGGRNFEVTPTQNGDELTWEYSNKKPLPEQAPENGGTAVKNSEIASIFAYLEKQVPHKDASDGCFARADYSAYLMQVVLKLKNVGKIRAEVESGKLNLKPPVGPFKEAAKDKAWNMHTAAHIRTEEGDILVMDVALSTPLSPGDWIDALKSHTKEDIVLKITNTMAWDDDLQNSGKVSMIDMLSQLRGLYLSERAGEDKEGKLDPWGSWQIAPNFESVHMHGHKSTRIFRGKVLRDLNAKGAMIEFEKLDDENIEGKHLFKRLEHDTEEGKEIIYLPSFITKVKSAQGNTPSTDIETINHLFEQ